MELSVILNNSTVCFSTRPINCTILIYKAIYVLSMMKSIICSEYRNLLYYLRDILLTKDISFTSDGGVASKLYFN